MKYIGSLLGRIFLISDTNIVDKWGGYIENSEDLCDYDLLDNVISYDDGDVAVFNKSDELTYLVYFSMSQKIEIFQNDNGIIICDGMYFNQSINTSTEVSYKTMKKINIEFKIENNSISIFDASISGQEVKKDEFFERYPKELITLNIRNVIYQANQVEVTILENGKKDVLMGIELY